MLKLEWDVRRARQNEAKHGVSLERATQVFDGPKLVLTEDAAHSRFEMRYFAFGEVDGGILTVPFAARDERVRIFGAGYWRKGKVFYEQASRLPR